MLKKTFKVVFFILSSIYVIGCAILFLNQERLLFRASQLPDSYSFGVGTEVEVPIDEEQTLNGLWIKETGSKGVILYFHGNKGSIRRALYQARCLTGHGYDIFIPDYRGFGKTEGSYWSEKGFYHDAEKVYQFLLQHYEEKEIAIFGYSLGSAPSTYLAQHYDPQQVFLVAPFTSITDLKREYLPIFPSLLIKYKFDNSAHLASSNEEVTIFHGTRDPITPHEHSVSLSSLRRNIQLFSRNESHRSIIFDPIIPQMLRQKLK